MPIGEGASTAATVAITAHVLFGHVPRRRALRKLRELPFPIGHSRASAADPWA